MAAIALVLAAACTGVSSGAARDSAAAQQSPSKGADFLPRDKGWSLVWHDEFDGAHLDAAKWRPEVSCWGGGNEERQCYTDRDANIKIGDGLLHLIARKEAWTGPELPQERRAANAASRSQPYTSGKVRTLGLEAWKYGRFSARMKLPAGQGTWTAFWMMSSEEHYGAWPLSGEIDILEAVNLGAHCAACDGDQSENRVQGALHFGDPWPNNVFRVQKSNVPGNVNPADGFHVYSIEWGEGVIDWYVDDRHYMRITANEWRSGSSLAANNPMAPFDRPFYLMINLAVGGRLSVDNNAGGIDMTKFPSEVLVDWVRVYSCTPDPARALACLTDETSAANSGATSNP